MGGEEVLPLLEQALKDTNFAVREIAFSALGKVGGQMPLLLLATGMTDANPSVRRHVVLALGETSASHSHGS